MLPFDSNPPSPTPVPAIVWHPDYEMNIGRHVFPTEKFRLTKEQLVKKNIIAEEQILLSPKATDEELLSVLTPDYLAALRSYKHNDQTRKSELPITASIVESMATTAGGSILCGKKALETGAACHLGGGYHHGYPDHAEGFCYLNDIAIAVQVLLDEGLADRIAIVDLDVHQGNGTAATFATEPRVFTFSVHEEDLYPRQKETSTLDIGLEKEPSTDTYLNKVSEGLKAVLDFSPDLVVYAAGVDVYKGDKLGHFDLDWDGMGRRDKLVLESVASRGIPFFTVVAGGYARELDDTVGLHVQTVEIATRICEKYRSQWGKKEPGFLSLDSRQ